MGGFPARGVALVLRGGPVRAGRYGARRSRNQNNDPLIIIDNEDFSCIKCNVKLGHILVGRYGRLDSRLRPSGSVFSGHGLPGADREESKQ